MLYLNAQHIMELGISWEDIQHDIVRCIRIADENDYAQPLKPYLKYGNPRNRIIAMPAYIGGDIAMAGIKWIASFPDNIKSGIPRANSVTVLNNAANGVPLCIINTSVISAIRTAGVSAVVLSAYRKASGNVRKKVGIVGYGPIGRLHSEMCQALLGDDMEQLLLFDIQHIDTGNLPLSLKEKTVVCDSWQQVYEAADIFITCTVASTPYIDLLPAKGTLHLNVSLRDYGLSAMRAFDVVIVDDWEEVCREGTNIQQLHQAGGFSSTDALTLSSVVSDGFSSRQLSNHAIIFNPMGLAVFDMTTASHYYRRAQKEQIGISLE
ncbi:2,3-diaminopropionate biosynthesis protein SbnB [Chitinophaga oryzae]|uniref:2,3-diaminopropionate biosynthesis protein SbnB n=1 Tax=Chitinophaga oryzae TaxID=2725414 RepID=A0ABX6LGQ9_9BACT|nr:2,3-diaminopropionate biosynthesis protein SbnB [Chitinophaga oryzae]QJB39296.1 2,3-diaminopropionate biosynthesis protein SbnB [Chitinophaga oryzae]